MSDLLLSLVLLVARIFRPRPARPAGRHAAGLVDRVPADWSPLAAGTRYRIRSAALLAALPREEMAA